MLWLGFASGLPLALTSGTLQAWMTVEGLSLTTIGFATLIGQAYVFKFLWAPALDRYTPPLLGRRRGWLLVTQALLVACIAVMAMLSPKDSLLWLALAAVAVAFFSASQDIVFDAYRADVLPAPQRGAGAAVSVLGYRLGMIVSGGAALWLAERVTGWGGMYLVMAALMLIGVAATFAAPEPHAPPATPHNLRDAVALPLEEFFARPGAWAMLALIVCYKLGDAFAGALSTAFLIRGAGFGADEVGIVNKTFGLAATIVGALTRRRRHGETRSVPLAAVVRHRPGADQPRLLADRRFAEEPRLMAGAVGLENLIGGMGTTAFVALLMSLVDARFSATQFALLRRWPRSVASMSGRPPAIWSRRSAGRPSSCSPSPSRRRGWRCWSRCAGASRRATERRGSKHRYSKPPPHAGNVKRVCRARAGWGLARRPAPRL